MIGGGDHGGVHGLGGDAGAVLHGHADHLQQGSVMQVGEKNRR